MNANWKPLRSDVEWTRNLIGQLNHNAIWGIPRARSIWRLDKINKVFTLIYGERNEPDNIALRIILPMIGYRADEKLEPMTPEQVRVHMAASGTGKTIERPILPNPELN